MATHSSILAWRNPIDRGARRATVHKVTQRRTRLNRLSTYILILLACVCIHSLFISRLPCWNQSHRVHCWILST